MRESAQVITWSEEPKIKKIPESFDELIEKTRPFLPLFKNKVKTSRKKGDL